MMKQISRKLGIPETNASISVPLQITISKAKGKKFNLANKAKHVNQVLTSCITSYTQGVKSKLNIKRTWYFRTTYIFRILFGYRDTMLIRDFVITVINLFVG